MLPKKFLMILPALLLTGCWWTKEEIPPTVIVSPQIPIVARPTGVTLRPVTFDVVTEENLSEFLNENTGKYGVAVFVSMDVVDYESLSLNVAELKRYIKEQQAIIEYYETRIKNVPFESEQP